MLIEADEYRFPYLIGFDLSGVVASVGDGVKTFKVGDEVFSRVPEQYRGTVAQYAITTESTCALKPKNLSFAEAAAVPLAGITALQALDEGEKDLPGGLKGKTVFVPGALSGTGSFAVQMAKNCFGAAKTITSLSPGKITQVESLLGSGTPDLCVDYTKNNVIKDVGEHSVDFMFDTQKYTLSAMSIMKKGGQIVSISTIPNGTTFKAKNKDMPTWLELMMNLFDWVFRSWASWKGVSYGYLVMEPKATDLERLKGWIEEGKVKSVVGENVKLSDIRGVCY
jgi:NADPH:quinone reductase-like Zn-dependent oxidoreductase